MNPKSKIIQKVEAGDNSTTIQVAGNFNANSEFVDKEIRSELDPLVKARFFSEYDRVEQAKALGGRVCKGNLEFGSGTVRCLALAWCSRILSTANIELAQELFDSASKAGECLELHIAKAFLLAKNDKTAQALKELNELNAPKARTAALMIHAQNKGRKEAIEWVGKTGIKASEFDSEGRLILLQLLLNEGKWCDALSHLGCIVDQDYIDTPVLHHATAITLLLSAVPEELRATVLEQIPLNASKFPLADNGTGIEARRQAHQQFTKAKEIADSLNCPETARVEEQYALWIELLDHERKLEGLKRLDKSLRSSAYSLHLVPLALDFGIDLNIEDIDRKISQQVALRGGPSMETSMARIRVGLRQKTPKKAYDFLGEYFDELKEHLNPIWLQSLQVEMLAKSGLLREAEKLLNDLQSDGLHEAEVEKLRQIVSEIDNADPIELLKETYKQNGALSELQELVSELHGREDWAELTKFAKALYERTGNLHHAEIFVKSLHQSKMHEGIVEFLTNNSDLIDQSQALQISYAWALFHQGEFILAKKVLSEMSCGLDDPNYRGLSINLAIFTGEWESLLDIVAHEKKQSEQRNARESLQIAQLAVNINAPPQHAKDLVYSAIQKANGDSSIYASAYFLSIRAGWDENNEMASWLKQAAELSDENGPIQKVTLQDVMDMRPDWDARVSKISKHLKGGEIPMFMAGDLLNRSLLSMTLFPALLNIDQPDPRRRILIPAYSGNRSLSALRLEGKAICLDTTALISLAHLDLLDQVLDVAERTLIPHATLFWLFEEKQKIEFHQPTRIRDAHKLRDLISTGKLETFNPSTRPESDLADQVGDGLALFISEAKAGNETEVRQHLVVKPGPVHQVGSSREEEVDLSSYSDVLCSCLSLVEKLKEKAQLTNAEFDRAKSYLSIQEKPWPNQPLISDGAVFYLDDVTISYLIHLGLLDKLYRAGFKAIVSPSEYSESNALIGYSNTASQINSIIDKLKHILSNGIAIGKVKIGKVCSSNTKISEVIPEHPSVDVIALVQQCDLVISDDRFFNKHQHMGDDQKPIYTTLDVLNALTLSGRIDANTALEKKIYLLRSGYAFIPTSEDELARHLEACPVRDGKVVESIELKAIRESLLCLRMYGYLKIPDELPWLINTHYAFVNVLKRQWLGNTDENILIARSDWIFKQLDARGWAGHFKDHNGPYYLKEGGLGYILMLMHAPHDASPEAKLAYQNWVNDRILIPFKQQFPDSYDWIVKHEKELFINLPIDDKVEEVFGESEL